MPKRKSSKKSIQSIQNSILSMSKSVWRSKLLMYALLLISILNVLYYLTNNRMQCLFTFLGIATVCYFFTKDVKIILGVPLIMLSLYVWSGLATEAFEDKTSDKTEDKSDDKKKSNEEFVSTIQPASLDEEDDIDSVYIDKSKTIENAYASLDKYLDSDGIQKLSTDTNTLIKKQSQLMDSMKHMGPLIKNMDGIIKNLNSTDMSQFTTIQSNLQDMVGKMSDSGKK